MKAVNAESSYEDVAQWLFSLGRSSIVPREEITVSEWADEYRMLSSKASREPGPWRTARAPYLRAIQDALGVDSPFEWVILMKGAQVGATEMGLNWLGYIIDLFPAPTMLVWPTEQSIKSNMRIRIDPFFQSTPCVGEKIGDASGPKDGANNTFLKEFPRGYLAIAASNSTSALKSKPVCNLFLDEVDEYPGNASQQGDPVMLAVARTATFEGKRKIFADSTPTIEGASRIEMLFNDTDRQYFYVPCPFCRVYQKLVWEQMRWEQGKPQTAYYECPYCEGQLKEHHKDGLLAEGEWRPEGESINPKAVGFHLSALYSPAGMRSWASCVAEYLEALKNVQKLIVWTNTILGLPYVQKGERPDWERLYLQRGGYEIGEVPEGVLMITAGADVQSDRIEAEVVGWGRNKESWSLGYYVFPGKTDDINGEAWNGLRDLLNARFAHPSAGVSMPIQIAGVDSGYNTTTVYNFGREYDSAKVAILKGLDSLDQPIGISRLVDVKLPNGKHAKRSVRRWPVGVSVLKHELYSWLRLPRPEGAASAAPGYCHFPGYQEEFFKQLTAEHFSRRESRSTHLQKGEWKKDRERNEALDCRIYARAAAAIARIDMFKEREWERLERSLGISTPPPAENPRPSVPDGPKVRQERRRYRSKGLHS